MIIRNRTTKTLEASPLNNRGCAVPPDRDKRGTSTLKGSPIMLFGHSFRVLASIALNIRGCSLRSYPRLLSEDRVAVSLVVRLRIIIAGCQTLLQTKGMLIHPHGHVPSSTWACAFIHMGMCLHPHGHVTSSPWRCSFIPKGMYLSHERGMIVPRTWDD